MHFIDKTYFKKDYPKNLAHRTPNDNIINIYLFPFDNNGIRAKYTKKNMFIKAHNHSRANITNLL